MVCHIFIMPDKRKLHDPDGSEDIKNDLEDCLSSQKNEYPVLFSVYMYQETIVHVFVNQKAYKLVSTDVCHQVIGYNDVIFSNTDDEFKCIYFLSINSLFEYIHSWLCKRNGAKRCLYLSEKIVEFLYWRLVMGCRDLTDSAITQRNCTEATSQTAFIMWLKSTSSIFYDDIPTPHLDERKLKVCHSNVVESLEILENECGWRKCSDCTLLFKPGHWSHERKLPSIISKIVMLFFLSTAEKDQWMETISNVCVYNTIRLGKTSYIDGIYRCQPFLHLRRGLWSYHFIECVHWYECYLKDKIKCMTEKMDAEGENMQQFEFLRATGNGAYKISCLEILKLVKISIGQRFFLNEIPIVDCAKLPCIVNAMWTLKECNRKQYLFERIACFSFEIYSRITFDIKRYTMQVQEGSIQVKELHDWLYLEETIKIRNKMNYIPKNLFQNVHEKVYTNRCQLCSKDGIATLLTCSLLKNITKTEEKVLDSRQTIQEYCAENPSNIPLYNKTGKGDGNRAKNLDDTFPFNSRPKPIKDERNHDEVKINSDLIIFRKSGAGEPRLLSQLADILVEFLAKLLLIYFFVSTFGPKAVNAEYCGISQASMEIVDSCPVDRAEWAQRSAEKNCFSYFEHFNCSQPEKYVYHCVIDHFIREKIEICALESYINLGYCAEYDTKGELIQANYDAKCHQCPLRYLSSEAYKYYKSKKSADFFSDPESTRSPRHMLSDDLNVLGTKIPNCELENDAELIYESASSISLEEEKVFFSRSTKMFEESVIVAEQDISDDYKLVPSGHCDSSYADAIRYLDDCCDEPDISVREKEPFLVDYMDEEYQNMKAEATRKLNLAMLNLAIYAEKDGDILLPLLQDDVYKTIFKEIETCDGTQITYKKIELLEHYAEKVECIVNDF